MPVTMISDSASIQQYLNEIATPIPIWLSNEPTARQQNTEDHPTCEQKNEFTPSDG